MSRGGVTYLLTDVAGSTALWERAPAAMAEAMARHDAVVEEEIRLAGGELVGARGEGDSRFVVFARAEDALAAAAAVVQRLRDQAWPTPDPLTVRVAVHTGQSRRQEHYGPDVNRAVSLRATAHPGQILVSAAAAAAAHALPAGLELRDVSAGAERVFQLVAPGIEVDFPPLVSNLPRQSDEFVGRDVERAHLAKALESARLVTVTGPGGTGKTRLALEVAGEQAVHHRDGVWLVALAAVRDATMIPAAIARALGVPVRPDLPAAQAVEDFLRAKEMLIVLDNCEHLVSACADVVARLLAAAPALRVLATSRHPLGAKGEKLWPLGPLDCPDVRRLPPAAELLAYDAVALFVKRATAVQPAFTFDGPATAAVAQICAHLDGMPLAVELAAARLRSMTLPELADQLADRFSLVGDEGRSLRAALDWSWNLLSGGQQRVLRRLSPFVGGFELEAAEAVATAGAGLDLTDVLDALVELVDASLLVPDHGPSTRYRFLETVRAYAEEQMVAAGEEELARDLHLAWLADVFEEGFRNSTEPVSPGHTAHFDLESDNLHAALSWAERARRLDGLRLAGLLPFLWWARGQMTQALSILPVQLDAFPGAPPLLRARALTGLGFLESNMASGRGPGYSREAVRLIDEHGLDEWWVGFALGGLASESVDAPRRGYELALARGHRHAAGYCCQVLGNVATRDGDLEEAARWFEEGVALVSGPDGSAGRGRLLSSLADVSRRLGQLERAQALWQQVLRIGQDLSDPIGEAGAHQGLGRMAMLRGDLAAAEEHFRRQVELGRQTGMPATAARALTSLTALSLSQGDLPLARHYAEESVRENALVGHPYAACSLDDVAHIAVLQGDLAAAHAAADEALDIACAADDAEHEARALVMLGILALLDGDAARAADLVHQGLARFEGDVPKDHLDHGLQAAAMVAARAGDRPAAARLLGGAEAMRRRGKAPWLPVPQMTDFVAAVRAALGDRVFDDEHAIGVAWSMAEAMSHAHLVVDRARAHRS